MCILMLYERDGRSCGAVEVLQWLRRQDPPCPWDPETCRAATEHSHVEVLQWLCSQNPPCPWDNPPCPWDPETCSAATEHSHMEVLQWL